MSDPKISAHAAVVGDHPSSREALEASLGEHIPGRRGELLRSFVRLLHTRTTPAYFSSFRRDQLRAGVVSMFEHLERSRGDEFLIRAHNPTWLVTRDGEARTVIEVVGPDQPFLVDTLRELVRVRGHQTIELFHPIVTLERNPGGAICSLLPPSRGRPLTSFQHLEIGRIDSTEQLAALEAEAREVFTEARRVAVDFDRSVEKVRESVDRLRAEAPRTVAIEEREEIAETVEFLEWLLRSNFVFLGFRQYDVRQESGDSWVSVARGSGLGILRDETRSAFYEPRSIEVLPADLRRRVVDPQLLIVHKTNAESRVVRRTRMDYVGIKRLDAEGRVVGEERFLGLFTARALGDLPSDIPILRRKLYKILESANVVQGSHDHKEMFSIFCSLPKTELFLNDVDALQQLIFTELETRDRLDVRVRYRADSLERAYSDHPAWRT